jgi:Sucrase/ferredoxin-like
VFLVCAHSKHDVCCALRGRPAAAALAAERPGQVWECSHVGGERFSANVLVLPLGLLYGRVLPIAAPEFVAAADQGEVIGALLRGRIGLPSPAQAALAYAYDHLALRRADALRVEQVGPMQDGQAVVRLSGPHGPIQVTVRVEKVLAEGLTCANPGPNSYFAYRPVSVVALDD